MVLSSGPNLPDKCLKTEAAGSLQCTSGFFFTSSCVNQNVFFSLKVKTPGPKIFVIVLWKAFHKIVQNLNGGQ